MRAIGGAIVHAALASSAVWGCADDKTLPTGSTDVTGGPTCAPGDVGCVHPGPSTTACATPAEGCTCESDAATIDCGQVHSVVGTTVNCSIGKRVCVDGKWGACKGDYIASRSSTIGSGLRLAALGLTANGCAQNPCNPSCAEFADTANGLDAPPDKLLAVTDAGLTLQAGVRNDDGPECTAFTVSPSTQTITVTAIKGSSALPTTTPAALTYTGALTPAGCFEGDPPANWILNRPDLAIMTPTGRLTVVAPVAGPIYGTAYLGLFPGVPVTANVIVNANEIDPAVSAATGARFGGTSSTADPMTILYPYPVSSGRPTVFPLGLAAPVVQWSTGGSAADAIKISLRYPAGTGALFSWTRILPEGPITLQTGPVVTSHGPAATISHDVWWAFENSAKGGDAVIAVQRVVGGVLQAEKTIPIRFANGALKGTVYYQSYGTNLVKNWTSIYRGGVADDRFGAATLSIKPGAEQPELVTSYSSGGPGQTESNGCIVCHSVASGGTRLMTMTQNGYNRLLVPLPEGATSYGSVVSDYMGDRSRPFGWPALYPDGTFFFSSSSNNDGDTPGQNSQLYGITASSPSVTVGTITASGSNGLPAGLQAMLPAFSPDGAHLSFGVRNAPNPVALGLNAGTNWNTSRDLAVMDFDVSSYSFSNLRRVAVAPSAPSGSPFASPFRTVSTLPTIPDLASRFGGAPTWTRCANENGTCSFSGTASVRYGANGTYYTRTATNGISCSNGVFGDPTPGVVKACDYQASGVPPYSGSQAHQSATANGEHQHYFTGAASGLAIGAGDTIFAYVYLDPTSPPSEVMLQWNDGSWEHRAYWGANSIGWGNNGTVSRVYKGALPQTGVWVRLEATAAELGLQGRSLNGMAFTLFGGKATWDRAGTKTSGGVETVWVDDSVPAGATSAYDGGDSWDWIQGSACSADSQCSPGVCATSGARAGQCTCTTDSQCSPGVCATSGPKQGLCTCSADSQCSPGVCNTTTGQCAACATNADCAPGVCLSGVCGCSQDSQCFPLGSCSSGSCVYGGSSSYSNKPIWSSFTPAGDGVVYELQTVYNGHDWAGTRSECDQRGPVSCQNTGARGELWIADASGSTSPVRLDAANGISAGKPYLPLLPSKGHNAGWEGELNYEPTVNPHESGGYAWVVFVSRRMYGNIANIDPWWSDPRFQDLYEEPTPKKLWVAAIDLSAPAGTDPSYPAFYLPGQELLAGNSRGFWVLNSCSAVGAECDTNDDCCGSSGSTPTAACRVVVNPAPPPVVKQCQAVSSTCTPMGNTCSLATDCCQFPQANCAAGVCVPPPPVLTYENATYTRVYRATCNAPKSPVWGTFGWEAVTPKGSRIAFFVQTSDQDTPAAWAAAPTIPLASVPDGAGVNAYPPNWMTADVDAALREADVLPQQYVRISMQLVPSSDSSTAPVLVDWRQRFDCVDAQ
jgi:hypothetical protein